MAKTRINISLDSDTAERLRQAAWENHTTVSGLITTWTWKAKVQNTQLRGQQNLSDAFAKGK